MGMKLGSYLIFVLVFSIRTSNMYKCSFSMSECGGFRDVPEELIKLLDCNDDCSKHLRSCHLSKLIGKIEEWNLILARVGMFDIQRSKLEDMWICPKHRYNLGRNWRPPTTCQFPLHSGQKKKLQNKDVINLELSKTIHLKHGVTVPLGAGICASCLKKKGSYNAEQCTVLDQQDDSCRIAKRLAALNIESCTTPTTPLTERNKPEVDWTPGQWLGQCASSDSSDEEKHEEHSKSLLTVYNQAMSFLSQKTQVGEISPLEFQLKTTWDETKSTEKEICIDKAIEGCRVVCHVIAPNAGQELLHSFSNLADNDYISIELKALMQAYKQAPTKSLKTQILSLYALHYPIKTLQRIHESYEHLTEWQIKKARKHAREKGSGFNVTKPSTSHRVRLPMALLNHFIDFVNRPYFHQDVAFGTRRLKLSNGEIITMPNVIRTVTRSTMINQYLQYCEEENMKPLSRSTLFRILAVREASQQKSLCGVDDTAADGSSGFSKIFQIVDELEQLGKGKSWADKMRKSLQDGKQYLKTCYRVHCQQDESECSDHCCKFSLSDPTDKDLQEKCAHEHKEVCTNCEDIKECFYDIEQVLKNACTRFYSDEHKEDLLYDFNKAVKSINEWKSHIMRSANQSRAKPDILNALDSSSILILMDWAMKFLQLRYREKQSEWYGKRGLSWHVSSVVSRDESGQLKVISYAHLFDKCTQDWYAVASIIEDLLQYLKSRMPKLSKAYLRSDEAGCYHSNDLIAAVRDIGERVGVVIERYDYSEPQSGKDMCDRILCPMKTAIRSYCCEGHDILTASDMRDALTKHPVRGTTASVNCVDEQQECLEVKKLDHISSFHNFRHENSALRAWKAYNIGAGKEFLYDDIYVKHQGPTMIQTTSRFFDVNLKERNVKIREVTQAPEEESALFECNFPGCTQTFSTVSQLESHLDIGQHSIPTTNEYLYDRIRKDWAAKFQSVDETHGITRTTTSSAQVDDDEKTSSKVPLDMGWALKRHSGSSRFSQNVKEYLTAKFMLGEKTGQKSDPVQIEKDMRNARNTSNERKFSREEWLTKNQIKGFFSRLAASRRKNIVGVSTEQPEDAECLVRDSEREDLIGSIHEELALRHPITYDVYDLCEYYKENKLSTFNVAMLKNICRHLEISFQSKDRKSTIVEKLKSAISLCECCYSES